MSEFSLSDINNRILENSDFVDDLKKTLNKIIIGQEDLINKIIIGMLSDGHILLEGVPGLAKTLTVKTFSKLIIISLFISFFLFKNSIKILLFILYFN